MNTRGTGLVELVLALCLLSIGAALMGAAAGTWSRLLSKTGPNQTSGEESPAPLASAVPRKPRAPSQTFRSPEAGPPPGPRYDQDGAMARAAVPVASYALRVTLDAVTHQVTGTGRVTWRNRSAQPTTELWLHLYLNAFKNSRTLFLRSPFGRARSGLRPTHWGYIDISKLRLSSGEDLWADAARHSPNDPDDATDIRVPLPRPVPPDGEIQIDVEWTSQLPSIVERTGFEGTFHMVGQWFPKLARLEPSGRWAHFAFHPYAEFYSDFGDYDVTIDVPAEMVVGATGQRSSESISNGRKVVRHEASSVHDFAWVAWDGFRERREAHGDVHLRILYPAGHESNAERSLRAARRGLDLYGRSFGAYPYPVLTLVHPPASAPAADGMEYPTLITTGAPWYGGFVAPIAERVTLHELGHQWFYGLLGTNEHAWPMLDEGLTTYAEMLAMHSLFGDASGVSLPGLSVDGTAYLRALAAEGAHNSIVAVPAPDFASFSDVGRLAYCRTAVLLWTLGGVYGHDLVRTAVGRYARRYRFEHPSPNQLIDAIREVLGDDAAEVLRDGLFGGAWIDFVAAHIQTTEATSPSGVFDHPSGRETVATPNPTPNRWVGQALVYRHGSLALPVEVDLIARDGRRTRVKWDGRSRSRSFDYEGTEPLVAVEVDPTRRILLDENLLNNATRDSPHAAVRTTEWLTYWLAALFAGVGP